MKIQINTDKHIQGTEKLEAYASEKINKSLTRFSDKITRIEVHLSDQNADKTGKDDIHCKIEARMKKLQPITVIGRNSAKEKALNDAVNKMKAALDTAVGKMREKS